MSNTDQIKSGASWAIGFGSIVLAVLLAIYARHIFLLLFTAILFAIFLNGSADYLARKTALSYGLAVTVVLILISLVIIAFGFFTGPQLAHEFNRFVEQLPQFLKQAKSWINKTPIGDYLQPQGSAANGGNGNGAGISFLKGITGIFSSLTGIIVDTVVILIIGIYAATGHRRYTRSLLYLVPEEKKQKVEQIGTAIVNALRWWLIGRITMMAIVGVLTAIGLWILKVPLIFFLAFIAFLFTFVPYIGPIASAVPAIVLAFSRDFSTVIYVIILYTFIHTLEGYLITPWIQDRTVSIPPALLIFGQILVGFLAGVMGILMATPLLLVVILLVQILYVEDVLGYKVRLLGEHD